MTRFGRAGVFALGLLVVSARAQEPGDNPTPPRVGIPFRSAPVEADGNLVEWEGRRPDAVLDRVEQVWSQSQDPKMRWLGPDDLSAEFWFAYDAAHFYVAGRVRDDSLVPGRVGAEWHNGDAIELFFDLGDRTAPAAGEFGEDCQQIFLMPFSEERPWGLMDWRQRPAVPTGASLTGVSVAFSPLEGASGRYAFEAVIPFHNFPKIRGKREIGFGIAIDDHDEGRAGRYQYVTWNGRQYVDLRQNLGELQFTGLAPLSAAPDDAESAYAWIGESLRDLAIPLAAALAIALLLWGFNALSSRVPVVRPIGRAVGVAMFGLGFLLPGFLDERRLDEGRRSVQQVVEMLQTEVPRMEEGLLGGYRGTERDRVLADLLAGRTIEREQKYRYTFVSQLAEEGAVLGVGTRRFSGLGFDVRPYGIPLDPDRQEVFAFREPLPPGRLNVVVARPITSVSGLIELFQPDPFDEDFVELEVVTYGAGARALALPLEVPGPYTSVADPLLERMEVSYRTLTVDAPLESLGLRVRRGEGVRLVGLTWVSPEGGPTAQEPLFLGIDTAGGVPTDLHGQHPRGAGVELSENGGTAVFPLPADPAREFRKLWLIYHGVYRSRPIDLLGIGSHVCELTIDFAEEGVAPLVVAFQHQQTMFFGQDRANRELPSGGAVRVAQRWDSEDGEPRIDFLRQIDIPAGATPVSLRLRNTGPYAIRFRSATFGTEVPNVATSTADSPLLRRGSGEGLAPDLLQRLGGKDVAIYRGGRLSAATLPSIEQQERAALPDEAKRVVPNDSVFARVVPVGDGVVHEGYTVLRGEAWSGTVVTVFARDPEHGEFLRGVHRVGAALWIGALPVLLLMLSELLAILNNLRFRLVSVLTVATLVPLGILSLSLLQVIEGDHEARVRERAQSAVVSAEKQLNDEKRQLLVNAQTWLSDLVVVVRERGLLQREDLAEGFAEVLSPVMQSQLPPAWSGSGYLQFEFNPPPDGDGLAPASVHVGGDTLRSLDTQLRAEVGVYLVWSVPLIGVRCSIDLPGGEGTCALSVARQLDPAFLSSLRRDYAVLLCDAKGYPVEASGSESVGGAELAVHARRPATQTEREELLKALVPGKEPVVARHVAGGEGWIAGYLPLLDLQNVPRLLLGVVDVEPPATLPLEVGRIPVRAFFGGAAGFLLLLSLFLSFAVASRISRPIERLEEGAQQLGRGQLDVRVEAAEGGQLGRLTRAFNQMATDLRARIQDLRLLNLGIQELTSKLELTDVVASAAAFYARHSPADAVRVFLGSRDAERVEVVGREGEALDLAAPGVCALVEATGPFACRLGAEGLSLQGIGGRYRSALALPLIVGGRTRGAVVLLFEVAEPPRVDLDLLWTMAAQTASAIENARLYQTAVEDVRTGALRREYFGMRVSEEVKRAEAEGHSVALIGILPEDARGLASVLSAAEVLSFVEHVVRIVREALSRDALVCRSTALGLQILLREGRDGADAAIAALESALRARGPEPARGSGLAAKPVFRLQAVVFPDDGASAEFLFAALEARVGRGIGQLPRPARDPGAGLVLSSAAMAGVLRTMEKVAPTDISVLLIGETGTGKEVLADLIHRWSRRAEGPLVKVHCAALPESLLASELFGHERGAFTGATERKLGRFEQAQGGTIFLDEIGEISLDVQVKLLRVLQEREIDRVGGSQPVPVDVRVVAATNRDIEAMVRDGRFREDLYYRLQGMLIDVPPLRSRKEEIPALIELFRREAVSAGHSQVEGFTAEAMDELFRRDWPGNVRELRNTVLRAMVLATGVRVTRSDLLGLGGVEAGEVPSVARTDDVPSEVFSSPGLAGGVDPAGVPVVPARDTEPPARSGGRPARGGRGGLSGRAPLGVAGAGAVGPTADPASPPGVPSWVRVPDFAGWVLALGGEISSQDYAERAGVSGRTALRDLGRLTDEGFLVRVGRRRGARYRLAGSPGAGE
ncbi:MAG: sigma 54-interacting transcriptional regulator [Planctomycetota bacterium]|nr:sigma 54-interacting transcriptional regulator [Planctomycetota bacterium]